MFSQRGNFRNLKVWKEGMNVVKGVYTLTEGFPKEERYGLTSQMRRCSISIVSNIAEGNERVGTKDYLHFLTITMGSIVELETQLECASMLGFAKQLDCKGIIDILVSIKKMIGGLRKNVIDKNS